MSTKDKPGAPKAPITPAEESTDTGIASVASTGASAASASATAPESTAPPRGKYFNAVLHSEVQDLHKAGVWTDMGERWGNLIMRLRPFHVEAVVVRREKVEEVIRMELGLTDDEKLPAERNIDVNRAAVTMAITGCRGYMHGSQAQLSLASQRGFEIVEVGDIDPTASDAEKEIKLINFDSRPYPDRHSNDDKDLYGKDVREIFAPTLESMQFMTALIRAAKLLSKVKDDVIAPLGSNFVFGQHVELDWGD